jgi:hypothetical protein
VVPEPTSLGLMAVGAIGLLVRRKRSGNKRESTEAEDRFYGRRK